MVKHTSHVQTVEDHAVVTKEVSSPDGKGNLKYTVKWKKTGCPPKNLTCKNFKLHVKVHIGYLWETGPLGTSAFYRIYFSVLFGFLQRALIIFVIRKKKKKERLKQLSPLSQLST